jgi:hypothetical protein
MQQITADQLFTGGNQGRYYQFNSLVNSDTDPTVDAYPGMTSLIQDRGNSTSSDLNTLSLGIKTFSLYSSIGSFSAGQLIRAKSYSTVSGYMLGEITSAYSETGIWHLVVNVYEFHGSGNSSQWFISFQLNNGYSVIQNPNSPHVAKLLVADASDKNNPFCEFNVPYAINYNTVITSNTPTHYAGYYTTQWKWQTFIQEDFGDLHEPWLGTTVTVRVKIAKTTTTLAGSVVEYSFRDYNHTFTLADFDIYGAGFTPGNTYPDIPTPSTCTNESEDYIDNFVSTFETYKNSDGVITSINNVIYSFAVNSYVVNVSPGSFFEPPTP